MMLFFESVLLIARARAEYFLLLHLQCETSVESYMQLLKFVRGHYIDNIDLNIVAVPNNKHLVRQLWLLSLKLVLL